MKYIYEEYNEIEDFGDSLHVDYKRNHKFMDKLKSVFHWFVTSSANRNEWALTLRAGVPFLVLLGIGDTETLNHLVGSIGELVVYLGQLVAGLLTVWGLVRKIVLSYK